VPERAHETSPQPPQLHAGRYEIGELIGTGGLGSVHRGRLVRPGGFSREVAIKRLHDNASHASEMAKMILDEARVASAIRHPNVVATIDVVAEDGVHLIVMELVEGPTLRSLKKGGRALPVPIALRILIDVLRGLDAAHRATDANGEPLAVVHRDVAPPNILVGKDGLTRLSDFGIAKSRGRLHTTREGEVKGHLSYMAPEQLVGEAVDARTDIFGAGVVLWEALTGRALFDGDSEGEVVYAVLEREIVAPSTHRSGVPKALDECVLRAVARVPSDRFRSACEMADALERATAVATHGEVAAFVEGVARGDNDTSTAATETITRVEPVIPPAGAAGKPVGVDRRTRTFAFAAALVVLVALGGIAGWRAYRSPRIAVAATAVATAQDPKPIDTTPAPQANAPPANPPVAPAGSVPAPPVSAAQAPVPATRRGASKESHSATPARLYHRD
jgi:serine/threonine-protein kinase